MNNTEQNMCTISTTCSMNTLDTVYLFLYEKPQIRDSFNRSKIINYNRYNGKSNFQNILRRT